MTTTLTTTAKNAVTQTNSAKHSTTLTGARRQGSPWAYNQASYTYNQVVDPVLGQSIYYNSIDFPLTLTNLAKH